MQGVWRGNKAFASADAADLPDPLVIFGYGSLCWKPGGALEGLETFPCLLRGWTRLFAQRSTDHRGTPASPGLVVTLLRHEALQELPGFDAVTVPNEVVGMAYQVPADRRKEVLAELDFREKGGYSRALVEVESLEDGRLVPALVYSATTANPHFWWGDDGQGFDLGRAAHIINSSVGPSGPNIEYFDQLCSFFHAMGRPDPHLEALERHVARLQGCQGQRPLREIEAVASAGLQGGVSQKSSD